MDGGKSFNDGLTRKVKLILVYMFFVFINIAVNRIVVHMGLPLYVDNIGTLLGAVYGGYLPGIFIGYITNIINSTDNIENMYYAGISVLIGMSATFFARKGFYKKLWKALLTVPVLAIMGGGVGSVLTWFIYGSDNSFFAQLWYDFRIDLLDKLITVLGAYLLILVLPQNLSSLLELTDWRQRRMTKAELREAEENSTRGLTLRGRISLMITLVMIAGTFTTTIISYILYRGFAIEQMETLGLTMAEVNTYSISFVAKVMSLFLGFFVIVIVLCIWFAQYHLTYPIDAMTFAAAQFHYNTNKEIDESVDYLKGLEVKTGDEIENLYNVLTKTISDTAFYIEDIKTKGEQIEKLQSGLIYILADMVESRDKCTGEHIKKTAGYVRLILDLLQENEVYPGQVNDEFIQSVINSAPLHDVGKIKVSDLILNKTTRLDDDEYTRMKQHTLFGKDVIERAKSLSPGSDYLDEALNLALYHHEKWDGTGYPSGLKGEEIPLSARIMAVSDVFDALLSTRSYKNPFTFEQAMDIIKEGSGTSFDPAIVKLFVDNPERVKAIALENEKLIQAS
ncbi:MAG: HD domain-containing protein [Lachnospiraceae bacterium]|nr:HD domain-containing protein [Lachnospiraceae bacterium]